MDEATSKNLRKDLLINSKGLGIPEGAAEVFADKIMKEVEKNLKGKKIVTDSDLSRFISTAAKKYNKDLAYVYKIHDKII